VRRAILAALALALLQAAPAAASYGNGAHIVSASYERGEQADDVSIFGDVSADGRYVAFHTRARNLFADDDPDPPGQFRVGGIFRHDLATGGLQLVADGDLRFEATPEALEIRGAESPSISAGGRYVAFSTAQQLTPGDTNNNIDVYVRDMTVPLTLDRAESGAYELVSARDGTDAAAAYQPQDPPQPGREIGSELTAGSAISADGRTVVFRTRRSSDLPARPTVDTPDGQVFVRRLDAERTFLVTRNRASGAPAGGAAGPAGISADGSTVVWTGSNAPAQTELLFGENTDDTLPYYLWQRVSPTPGPTRRVTGLADPEDPGCPDGAAISQDQTATGPCYGPLTAQEQGLGADISTLLPAVSADGNRVAFLTGAGPRPNAMTGLRFDLYLVDMTAPSRKLGTVELTREGVAGDIRASSQLEDVVASPDGRFLALRTLRTTFVLPALTFVGAPRAFADARELYLIDLEARTIERAVRSRNGGDIDRDVTGQASLSAGAERLVFPSGATNLFVADANGLPDIFAATRIDAPPPEPPPPPETTGPDLFEDLTPRGPPRLPVSARSLRDGSVLLTIRVPGSGLLRAAARARLADRRARARRVAEASRRVAKAGRVKLRLRPGARLRRTLRRGGRVRARVTVAFTARRGGRRLANSLRVTFRMKQPQARRKR
jgi:hypothetical protein